MSRLIGQYVLCSLHHLFRCVSVAFAAYVVGLFIAAAALACVGFAPPAGGYLFSGYE